MYGSAYTAPAIFHILNVGSDAYDVSALCPLKQPFPAATTGL
jgi:hypothetical protein